MKKLSNAATLGFAAWTFLAASIGLSEPYKVMKGDTLSGIAAAYHVSVSDLRAANHIKKDKLRVGQVIVIPEPPTTLPPSASSNSGPSDSPGPPPVIDASASSNGGPSDTSAPSSATDASAPSNNVAIGSPEPPHVIARDAMEKSEITSLRANLRQGWVVTQNSSGKIFVHKGVANGQLYGLTYLVRETYNPDRTTSWTVYRPVSGADGTGYGEVVGVMEKPATVEVGECSCR